MERFVRARRQVCEADDIHRDRQAASFSPYLRTVTIEVGGITDMGRRESPRMMQIKVKAYCVNSGIFEP
jgi:hypothetical protein